jgi:hypothetical protein
VALYRRDVRWVRVPGWLAGAVLPLAVSAGLFVMHALDGPAHGAPLAEAPHGDHHAGADRPVAHDHGVGGAVPDPIGQADEGSGCAGCLSAVHVVVACLAVLVTTALLGWRRRIGLAATAFVPAVRCRVGSLLERRRPAVPRAAWVRLNVMLC